MSPQRPSAADPTDMMVLIYPGARAYQDDSAALAEEGFRVVSVATERRGAGLGIVLLYTIAMIIVALAFNPFVAVLMAMVGLLALVALRGTRYTVTYERRT